MSARPQNNENCYFNFDIVEACILAQEKYVLKDTEYTLFPLTMTTYPVMKDLLRGASLILSRTHQFEKWWYQMIIGGNITNTTGKAVIDAVLLSS